MRNFSDYSTLFCSDRTHLCWRLQLLLRVDHSIYTSAHTVTELPYTQSILEVRFGFSCPPNKGKKKKIANPRSPRSSG
ncbi:hypothetical protein I7I50_09719 [Histoplasma capsulatum G186AR]|uniref:Uncharacterized protein n=1 Tax=Ajellomyces capsulatus TaxID=5037 RepID=A0A8H7YVR8_AJECA|nr:hypothetical protein I7I52_07250 [Histoplasma capsulatum]QSS74502.1 hypothetical protein I7I50_09719 [Histoplasma capsulatum G186AR]